MTMRDVYKEIDDEMNEIIDPESYNGDYDDINEGKKQLEHQRNLRKKKDVNPKLTPAPKPIKLTEQEKHNNYIKQLLNKTKREELKKQKRDKEQKILDDMMLSKIAQANIKITEEDLDTYWPYYKTYLVDILNDDYNLKEAQEDIRGLIEKKMVRKQRLF